MKLDTARFRKALLQWYGQAQRDLPWRRTSDPYAIWISEVMLQQTRVAAALPYYQRFLIKFPDIATLATATEQELLAAWSGLGYYSRVRNLQKAARLIVQASKFPQSYESLLDLPGIGKYTAAAIASIAFDLPHAAVDGNLLRVIARLDDDSGDIASTQTRLRFEARAAELLDRRHPGQFNQAMMELGATVCLPRTPQCPECPVKRFCAASAAGRASELPIKLRDARKVQVDAVLLLIRKRGRILLHQRPADASQMPGFWELPEGELIPDAILGREAGQFRHTITFRQFTYKIQEAVILGRPPSHLRWLALSDLDEVPITTAARKALKQALYRER